MTRPDERIPVEPLGEARWERLERRLFEARDRERATAEPRARRSVRLAPFALAGTALVAVATVWLLLPRAHLAAPTTFPARIETPAGGSARVQVAEATLDVGGDAAVELRAIPGAVTLYLERGRIECDVEPGRPRSFVVVAGDVLVAVVGTRFSVERGASVRVEVQHGKVRVLHAGAERLLATGEHWDSAPTAAAAASLDAMPLAPPRWTGPTSLPAAPGDDADGAEPPDPAAPLGSAACRKALADAEELDAEQPDEALRRYRRLARGCDGPVGARALYGIAHLELRLGQADACARTAEEYERRFPGGKNVEDALWLRVQAYYRLDAPALRDTAREYLRRYPAGKHAELARRIAYW